MASKRGAGLAEHITQAEAPKQRRIDACSANGCPLAGTIRPENGAPVCGVHYLSNKEGWPKATGVIMHHLALYDLARKAQDVGTPMSTSADSAAVLFETARAHGLQFNDAQREEYRIAIMKLSVAGRIVEAAIRALAVKASLTAEVKTNSFDDERPVDKEERVFKEQMRGLINNISLHPAS